MLSFFAISGIGVPLSLRARANRSMSSSMTLGRPPWLPLAAAACWPSRVFSRTYSRSSCAATARTANSIAPMPLGSWTPVSGPVSSSSWMPPGLQGRRQAHELGGVAGQALHLVGGEGDRLAGGGLLDVARQGEGFLELGPDFDPAADLLGEDALAVGALQGVDLDLQLLLRGRAARVADPDRGGGRLRLGGGDRRAGLPRRSGAAVGGGGDGQFLAQRGHEDEAGGVVFRGDFARSGAAGAAGRRLALVVPVALTKNPTDIPLTCDEAAGPVDVGVHQRGRRACKIEQSRLSPALLSGPVHALLF